MEVARSASVSRVRAARALPIEVLFKQKQGQEKYGQNKIVSFPGSFGVSRLSSSASRASPRVPKRWSGQGLVLVQSRSGQGLVKVR